MSLYEKILEESRGVDSFWVRKLDEDWSQIKINFEGYRLEVEGNFAPQNFPPNTFFIVDQNLNLSHRLNSLKFVELVASESETKDISFIENLAQSNESLKGASFLVGVGGGIVLDVALTLACLLNKRIILVPTSILAMSDSGTGGRARANKIEVIGGEKKFLKHFFRRTYLPEKVLIYEEFLHSLRRSHFLFGCAEIIKHAFFQSKELLDFLLSESFDPKEHKKGLLKAILWTQDLKKVCFHVDPEETVDGGKRIIREGHVYADKLEKESGFQVSHGEAVLKGIEKDLLEAGDKTRLNNFKALVQKLTNI
jgi:3-dehydroquinate synthetase